jgi:hypothetical protein
MDADNIELDSNKKIKGKTFNTLLKAIYWLSPLPIQNIFTSLIGAIQTDVSYKILHYFAHQLLCFNCSNLAVKIDVFTRIYFLNKIYLILHINFLLCFTGDFVC